MKKSQEPLSDEQVWGGKIYFTCANHPDRIGFKDLGMNAPNRYPCHECYTEIIRERQKKAEK